MTLLFYKILFDQYNLYALLSRCEVKMTGYCPFFFLYSNFMNRNKVAEANKNA